MSANQPKSIQVNESVPGFVQLFLMPFMAMTWTRTPMIVIPIVIGIDLLTRFIIPPSSAV